MQSIIIYYYKWIYSTFNVEHVELPQWSGLIALHSKRFYIYLFIFILGASCDCFVLMFSLPFLGFLLFSTVEIWKVP